MTDKFLSAVIHSKVKKVFADNEDAIVSQLAAECDPEQNLDPVAVKLLVRGMMLSAQVAVQITLRILEDVGVIETQSDAVAFTQLINDEISKSDGENVSEFAKDFGN